MITFLSGENSGRGNDPHKFKCSKLLSGTAAELDHFGSSRLREGSPLLIPGLSPLSNGGPVNDTCDFDGDGSENFAFAPYFST